MEGTIVHRPTERVTFDGKPLTQLKINGDWHYFVTDGDNLVEYDPKIEEISFSYSHKKDDQLTVIRTETKKILKKISGNRVMGFHEYTTPDKSNVVQKAIVVWGHVRGGWYPSMKKGISGLVTEDISLLKDGIAEIGW